MPLIVSVTPSFHVSIQSSSSCSFQEQQRILGLFELSQEFKQQHYLTGLLLTELSAALDMESEGYGNTDTFELSPYYLVMTKLFHPKFFSFSFKARIKENHGMSAHT